MSLGEQIYSFFTPTVTSIGIGSSKKIGEQVKVLGGTRALIVTDKIIAATGISNQVKTRVEEAGVKVFIFDGAEPNPTDIKAHDGLRVFQKNQCDMIISLGGVNSHDCAKDICIVASNGGIRDSEGIDKSGKSIPPFVSINTTAGTDSEMTPFCIISGNPLYYRGDSRWYCI
ncbi:iron-containing alcohol dehydrogenase [Desulfofarcimen acetoxidans DSM 771]|jgi:alcohol dehydrogenase|uniref:Iron-containing alcohol dehydrogenase n=1 Tax=Desulfofarcimen acetoxidans (strain ATCC 49208 / DSM 771 / KCTC 5769 / VKM B-1644 / 5575) TaxID=485916 RepID=C8VW60_DESAS|nr:iron-containing alcohol dehydrogenase [Desulfofarcimen acetoxidans DSM 771]